MRFNGANTSQKSTSRRRAPGFGSSAMSRTSTMDTNGVEIRQVNALGGADTVTVGDLAGTSVTRACRNRPRRDRRRRRAHHNGVIAEGTAGGDNFKVAESAAGRSGDPGARCGRARSRTPRSRTRCSRAAWAATTSSLPTPQWRSRSGSRSTAATGTQRGNQYRIGRERHDKDLGSTRRRWSPPPVLPASCSPWPRTSTWTDSAAFDTINAGNGLATLTKLSPPQHGNDTIGGGDGAEPPSAAVPVALDTRRRNRRRRRRASRRRQRCVRLGSGRRQRHHRGSGRERHDALQQHEHGQEDGQHGERLQAAPLP